MRWVNQWMDTVFAPPIDKSDKSHVCEPSSKLGTSRDQVVLWIESWWWILNAVNHLSLEMIISPIDVVDYLVDPKAINLYDWGWLYIYIQHILLPLFLLGGHWLWRLWRLWTWRRNPEKNLAIHKFCGHQSPFDFGAGEVRTQRSIPGVVMGMWRFPTLVWHPKKWWFNWQQ